jgi:hypothetical protein
LKRKRDEELTTEAIPQSPDFLSPQGPNVIGPTPQRDGIVLGLFDMLPAGTPSKKRAVLADVEPNVLQTPSRKAQDAASEASQESRARGERTPLSNGKRFMLNQFVTPKKRTLDEQGTPSTIRGLATPAFLRRGNALGAIDEADEATPRPAPWKRRGLGRSLSAMIQAMKKDEDDKLDEEADIMREMEMEEAGISLPPKKPRLPQVQIEDSQAPMPLGPDRGLETDEDEDEEPKLGPDGKPRRAWKKKGLKRQTRRVNSESYRFVKVRDVLTAPQSNPQSQNQSRSPHCRYETTQMTSKTRWQRHKQLNMKRASWTRRTMCLTTQATSLTHQRDAKCRRRTRKKTRISQRKGLLRRRHARSRHRHMQISGDSRSRAVPVQKVVQRASLVVGGNRKRAEGSDERSDDLV